MRCRSFYCLNNIIEALDIDYLGGLQMLYTLCVDLSNLIVQKKGNNLYAFFITIHTCCNKLNLNILVLPRGVYQKAFFFLLLIFGLIIKFNWAKEKNKFQNNIQEKKRNKTKLRLRFPSCKAAIVLSHYMGYRIGESLPGPGVEFIKIYFNNDI